MKLPASYTTQVLTQVEQDWISFQSLKSISHNILTPPYVSNIPEIVHVELPTSGNCFLLLASDGLASHEYPSDMERGELENSWVTVLGSSLEDRGHALLLLLREVIGGTDLIRVSRNLTVEMEQKWLDDITVILRRF
jgi:pyruvate dehydrogenase phosphatase